MLICATVCLLTACAVPTTAPTIGNAIVVNTPALMATASDQGARFVATLEVSCGGQVSKFEAQPTGAEIVFDSLPTCERAKLKLEVSRLYLDAQGNESRVLGLSSSLSTSLRDGVNDVVFQTRALGELVVVGSKQWACETAYKDAARDALQVNQATTRLYGSHFVRCTKDDGAEMIIEDVPVRFAERSRLFLPDVTAETLAELPLDALALAPILDEVKAPVDAAAEIDQTLPPATEVVVGEVIPAVLQNPAVQDPAEQSPVVQNPVVQPSVPPRLSNLEIQGLALSFSPETTTYTVTVSALTSVLVFRATLSDPSLGVELAGLPLDPSALLAKIVLPGRNTFVFRVTNQAGEHFDYTVKVQR